MEQSPAAAGPSGAGANAAQERTAGEASTSAGTSGTKDKPIVVLIIGKVLAGSQHKQPHNTVQQPPLTAGSAARVTIPFASTQICNLLTRESVSVGMAGSGKTTLIQRINAHMHQHQLPGYIINLDPAVTHLPYGANIDIRDTVRGVWRT